MGLAGKALAPRRLHTAAAPTIATTVLGSIAVAMRPIGPVRRHGLACGPLSAPGEGQDDQDCREPYPPKLGFLCNGHPASTVVAPGASLSPLACGIDPEHQGRGSVVPEKQLIGFDSARAHQFLQGFQSGGPPHFGRYGGPTLGLWIRRRRCERWARTA
jgi:hypothetical protein